MKYFGFEFKKIYIMNFFLSFHLLDQDGFQQKNGDFSFYCSPFSFFYYPLDLYKKDFQ